MFSQEHLNTHVKWEDFLKMGEKNYEEAKARQRAEDLERERREEEIVVERSLEDQEVKCQAKERQARQRTEDGTTAELAEERASQQRQKETRAQIREAHGDFERRQEEREAKEPEEELAHQRRMASIGRDSTAVRVADSRPAPRPRAPFVGCENDLDVAIRDESNDPFRYMHVTTSPWSADREITPNPHAGGGIYRPARYVPGEGRTLAERLRQHYRFRISLVERNVKEGTRTRGRADRAIAMLRRSMEADVRHTANMFRAGIDIPALETFEDSIETLDRLGGDQMQPPCPWAIPNEDNIVMGNRQFPNLRRYIQLLEMQGGRGRVVFGEMEPIVRMACTRWYEMNVRPGNGAARRNA